MNENEYQEFINKYANNINEYLNKEAKDEMEGYRKGLLAGGALGATGGAILGKKKIEPIQKSLKDLPFTEKLLKGSKKVPLALGAAGGLGGATLGGFLGSLKGSKGKD